MTEYEVSINGTYRLRIDQNTSVTATWLTAHADVPDYVSNVSLNNQPSIGADPRTDIVGEINRTTVVGSECREAAIEAAFEWSTFDGDDAVQIESVRVKPTDMVWSTITWGPSHLSRPRREVRPN